MLPQPNDGFAWVQVPGWTALVCQALTPIASHFFTTRAWQLGSAPAEERDRAWADVAVAAGVPPARLVRLRQVHGATVVAVRRSGSAARDDGFPGVHPEADILVSDDGAAALTIQTADCVPLLIAGWNRAKAVAQASELLKEV